MYIMLSIIQANFDYLNYAQAIVATRTLIRAVKASLSKVISHTVPLQCSAQRSQVDKLSLVPSLPPGGVRLGQLVEIPGDLWVARGLMLRLGEGGRGSRGGFFCRFLVRSR